MNNITIGQNTRINYVKNRRRKRGINIPPLISLVSLAVGFILCTIGIITISVACNASEVTSSIDDQTENIIYYTPHIAHREIIENEFVIYGDVTEIETQITEETTVAEPSPRLVNLGEFRLTAYCPCEKCCGKWGKDRPLDKDGNIIVYTASGKIAREGYTIAADKSLFPFGTILYIDGQPYEVQDVGGAIKENRIDVYFESHQDALNFGVQYMEVFIEVYDSVEE